MVALTVSNNSTDSTLAKRCFCSFVSPGTATNVLDDCSAELLPAFQDK
jgi:hypothetical protein